MFYKDDEQQHINITSFFAWRIPAAFCQRYAIIKEKNLSRNFSLLFPALLNIRDMYNYKLEHGHI